MRVALSKLGRQKFCSCLQRYVVDSRIGGHSSEGLYEIYAGKYENKALLEEKERITKRGFGTTIVTTAE